MLGRCFPRAPGCSLNPLLFVFSLLNHLETHVIISLFCMCLNLLLSTFQDQALKARDGSLLLHSSRSTLPRDPGEASGCRHNSNHAMCCFNNSHPYAFLPKPQQNNSLGYMGEQLGGGDCIFWRPWNESMDKLSLTPGVFPTSLSEQLETLGLCVYVMCSSFFDLCGPNKDL